MPCQIDAQEVLAYLNELGYKNISAQQLKEFIRDLKKLIKYDLRIHRLQDQENIENVQPQGSDIFQSLYETGTAASRAREIPKKEKVISVQIKKPMMTSIKQPCRHTEDKGIQFEPNVNGSAQTSNASVMSSNFEKEDTSVRPKSCTDVGRVRSREVQLKPKASFIRPRMPVKKCKSDPVALYHQYQAEWKRQKFPGEDSRSDLRWAIRERMLGEPHVLYAVPSVEVLSRKQSNLRRV